MRKNKMLSLAAAIVLTSSAAMAFDTGTDTGAITLVEGSTAGIQTIIGGIDGTAYTGGYVDGNAQEFGTAAAMTRSAGQLGDALVYPAFKADTQWGTDIVVRNTSGTNAMIAKVVLYSEGTSEEVLDFNIYLSNKDVFTFNIKDGKVTTTDASTPVNVSSQATDNNKDAVIFNTAGNPHTIGTISVTGGYVVIYGMASANGSAGTAASTVVGGGVTVAIPAQAATYHLNHVQLWKDYRNLLDNCRGVSTLASTTPVHGVDNTGAPFVAAVTNTWRNAFTPGTNGMKNGMVTNQVVGGVTSPSVDLTAPGTSLETKVAVLTNDGLAATCGTYAGLSNATGVINGAWSFVSAQPVLEGSVRISNATDASRDMVLPATAIANFTDVNQALLWSEGEYASFADRQMVAGQYVNATNVTDSNSAFTLPTNNVVFGFNENKDAETTLLVTQPYKRVLVQMSDSQNVYNAENLTQLRADGVTPRYFVFADAPNYGQFELTYALYDNEENPFTTTSGGALTSPYSGSLVQNLYDKELQPIGITTMLQQARANGFTAKEGFADVSFTSPNMAAIITKMNGSETTGDAQTNWSTPATY